MIHAKKSRNTKHFMHNGEAYCEYCGQKIRPRYLILEIISGITFLLFTICLISFSKSNIFVLL